MDKLRLITLEMMTSKLTMDTPAISSQVHILYKKISGMMYRKY
jgi:hypothetical protein